MAGDDATEGQVRRRAVLAAAATGFAGCGASTDEGATTAPPAETTSTATASPTPTPKPPIQIGLIAPLSGNMDVYGATQKQAAELAVEHVNAGGGVLGRPLELRVEDNESNLAAGREDLLPRLARDDVPAFVALGSGNVRLWGEAVAEHRILMVKSTTMPWSTATAGVRGDVRYAAATGHDERQRALAVGHALNDVVGADTAALLRPTWGKSDGPAARVLTAFEGELVTTVEYDPFEDGHDYGPELERVYSEDPDGVAFLGGFFQATGPLFDQAGEMGADVPWVAETTDASRLAGRLPDDGFPVYEVTPSPVETRGGTAFRSAYDGRLVGLAGRTYDAVLLVALAAHRAGEVTPAAIARNLRAVSRPPGEAVTGSDVAERPTTSDGPFDYVGASGEVDLESALAPVVPVAVESLRGGRETVATLRSGQFESLRG